MSDWQYGVRPDKSIWFSIGNPSSGAHYQFDFGAMESHARLAAAAPELLELLTEMVKHGSGVAWDDWFTKAEAAISKATGEAS